MVFYKENKVNIRLKDRILSEKDSIEKQKFDLEKQRGFLSLCGAKNGENTFQTRFLHI